MTVYTNSALEEAFIDDDGETEFVDSDGETIIIADGAGVLETGLVPFFGYPILLLWQ